MPKLTTAPVPAGAQPQPSQERLLATLDWLFSQPLPTTTPVSEEAS